MEEITKKLDNINITLEKMLDVIKKPRSPFLLILEIAGMFVGIFGIITLLDTIFKWLKEGIW